MVNKLRKQYWWQYITNKWEKVKSKSEKIIADILNEMKISYQYEKKLIIEDKKRTKTIIIFPDFTLFIKLKNWKRINIILEYFWLNSKKTYKKEWNYKKQTYKKYNIPYISLYSNDIWRKKKWKGFLLKNKNTIKETIKKVLINKKNII